MIPYTQLSNVHEAYKDHHERWRFLYASYMGGAKYKYGDYLTRYVYESEEEYVKRKMETPLDNHCRNVIQTYTSFLYKDGVARDLSSIEADPALQPFLRDADLDGRSFNAFMRDASIIASIYGSAWIVVDKPETNVMTRAQELEQEIRPYVSVISPLNVIDWEWERQPNGIYKLVYVKVFESVVDEDTHVYRIYTPDMTQVVSVNTRVSDPELGVNVIQETENVLGMVPMVVLYNERSHTRGIGVSDINDIADQQRKIFDAQSELLQLWRLSNHPSLVMTANTDAHAGAGSIITVDEATPEGLRPYLLQPNSQSVDGLLAGINETVAAIDKMAHLGGIRNNTARTSSGIAMQSEFQLLAAKLSEKASYLELAEEQIFRLWAQWQGRAFEGEIRYPTNYSMRDTQLELQNIKTAKDAGIMNQSLASALDIAVAELLVDDDQLREQIQDEIMGRAAEESQQDATMLHPETTAETVLAHLDEMIAEGLSNEEIKQFHPELTDSLIDERRNRVSSQGGSGL